MESLKPEARFDAAPMPARFPFRLLLLPALCAACLATSSAAAAREASLASLAHMLASPMNEEAKAEARKMVFQLLGRQSLKTGKVAVKVDGCEAMWAVVTQEPAQVVRRDGTPLGKMTRLGKDGLQALALSLPNFTEFEYQIVTSGPPVAGGRMHIEHYPRAPESERAKDIPEGRTERFSWDQSRIFPGTSRTVTVYIPHAYKAGEEACLMVWQDGSRHADPEGGMRVCTVFDHLIHRKEMPVTIGVFVDPGRKAGQKPGEKAANRSLEYDSLGDAYTRFLLEEILPETERRYGVRYLQGGRHRAVAGGSSGGICAFTAAWERPDQFGKVLCWVGTFVDIRGGNAYPYLLRVTERKPIRVYLLDGINDLDNKFGNWPLANRMMEASLRYMGYDHRMVWTQCFHGSKGMSPALPDALRWLWRDVR